MSNQVGRPSKYNETMLSMAQDYAINYRDVADDIIPSIAGLCCYLRVARSTIYEWKEQFPEFSDTLKMIEDFQERELLNGGLGGTMNPTISKLILTNHGYSDKQETSVTSPDGSMSPVTIKITGQESNGS